jgi:hypothetical protein
MFVVQMPSFVIDGVADGQIAAAAECGSDKPQVTLKSKRTPQATERRGEKIFPSKKGLRDDSPPPRALAGPEAAGAEPAPADVEVLPPGGGAACGV